MVDPAPAAPVTPAAGAPAAAAPAATETSILDGAKPASEKPAPEPNAQPEAGKNADGSTKPPAEAAPKTGNEKPPEPAKPLGAPEKYEPFKVPEGVTLDPKAADGFAAVAKGLGLSQDQAQKLVDFQTAAIKAATDEQAKTFETMQNEWKEATRKELGPKADEQLAYAAAFRDKFLSEGARKILNDAGLSNHPEMIKSFILAGKAISEDGFIRGNPAGEKGDKSPGDIVYPNQGKA